MKPFMVGIAVSAITMGLAPALAAPASQKGALDKPAVETTPAKKTNPAKKVKAPNPAFASITDDPALPRVLLIGDSISMGYTLPTRELLKGKANVHRIPENGGPTIRGMEQLDKWLGGKKWDVIHFNWGLHDLKRTRDGALDATGEQQVPVEQYEKNLRELAKRLKATGARLIWATTTPVPEGAAGRKPEELPLYNAAAAKVMKENGIAIDDLCAVAMAKCESLRPAANNVHYTPEGYRILAESAAASIEKALEKGK